MMTDSPLRSCSSSSSPGEGVLPLLGQHRIAEVGAVEAGHEPFRLLQMQLAHDILAHPVRRRRRQGQKRHVRQAAPQLAQPCGSRDGNRAPTPKCNAPSSTATKLTSTPERKYWKPGRASLSGAAYRIFKAPRSVCFSTRSISRRDSVLLIKAAAMPLALERVHLVLHPTRSTAIPPASTRQTCIAGSW